MPTSARGFEDVLSWMKGTDLLEVHFAQGKEAMTLRIADAQTPLEIPPNVLLPVTAPAVGVFRFGPPGRPRKAREGEDVAQGDVLGQIESGSKKVEAASPAKGRIVQVLVEDGQAVEYGRPLFVIEPR